MFLLVVSLASLLCQQGVGASEKEATQGLLYLQKYGYLSPRNQTAALTTPEGLQNYIKTGVKDLQAFAGLPQTGELDEATVELMRTPRCGVRDIIGHGATARRRRRRYVLQGSRWRVSSLTYRVTEYPADSGLTNKEVDDTIKKGFDLWSAVTDLSFSSQESGSVHIEIRFASYEHGDGDPFDGPGGTLAHAYFPAYGGDMHIDDSELWTINNFRVRVPGSGLELSAL